MPLDVQRPSITFVPITACLDAVRATDVRRGRGKLANGITNEGVQTFALPLGRNTCPLAQRSGCKPYGRLTLQIVRVRIRDRPSSPHHWLLTVSGPVCSPALFTPCPNNKLAQPGR